MPKTPESTPSEDRGNEREPARAESAGPNLVLDLQRSAGNAAVGALLRRTRHGGGVAAPGIRLAGALLARETAKEAAAKEAKEDTSIVDRAKGALKKGGELRIPVFEILWRIVNNRFPGYAGRLNSTGYEKGEKAVKLTISGKGDTATGSLIGGDEIVKRVANGQFGKVVAEVDQALKALGKEVPPNGSVDYVFLMGEDRSGAGFYTEAQGYFTKLLPKAEMVTNVRTLAGITERVHSGGKPVANLYIVSHAHESGVLQFSLDDLDKTPGQLQYDELADANKSGSLEQTNPKLIGAWTKIQIKGCAVGRSELTLKALKAAFGGKTSITAPTHAQAYGHDAKYGGEYEGLAGPYIEEKGVSKLTLDQAFKAMQAKPEYSFITAADWKSMRSGLKRFDVNESESVFSGDVPLDNEASALALLRKLVPATAKEPWTFKKKVVVGAKWQYQYETKPDASGSSKTTEIDVDIPPSDDAAIAGAKAKSGRPDITEFTVRRPRKGLELEVIVDAKRTSFELYHKLIKKDGQPFDPASGTKPWFAEAP
jgi:hypothetical protein